MDKIVISPIQGQDQGVHPDLSRLVILGSGLGCTQNTTVIKEVILPPEEVFSAGGLPRFIDMWKSITTDPVTLDAVSGLTIPFKDLPPCRLPTREELSSVDEDPVVDASVSELLALKAAAVVPSNSEGFYSKVQNGEGRGIRQEIHNKLESKSYYLYQDHSFNSLTFYYD